MSREADVTLAEDAKADAERDSIREAEALNEPESRITAEPEIAIVQAEPVEPPRPLNANEQRLARLKEISEKSRNDHQQPRQEPQADQEVIPSNTEAEATREQADDSHQVLIVNGVERRVTPEEMRTWAQKAMAADEKFEEAASLRKTYDKKLAELEKRYEEIAARTTPQLPSQDDVVTQQALSQDGPQGITAQDFDNAIYADDETRQQAMQRLTDRINNPIDEQSMIDKAYQQFEQRQALASVRTKDPAFAEILADPDLAAIADVFSGQILKTNAEYSVAENIEEALRRTKQAYPDRFQPPQPEPANPLSERQSAKERHARGNQAANSTRTVVGTDAPPPVSTKSVIEKMRAARP